MNPVLAAGFIYPHPVECHGLPAAADRFRQDVQVLP